MNVICLDCGIADSEAIWEYDLDLANIPATDFAAFKEFLVLLRQHRTHRLVIL